MVKRTRRPAPRKRKSGKRIVIASSAQVPDWVIEDVLAKKDLLASRELAAHVVQRYIGKHPALVARLGDPRFARSGVYEALRKWVRQELRVLVGMFVLETDPTKLLERTPEEVLAGHRSTAERLPYYTGLYPVLFGDKQPQEVLDLCCGLNPCSYRYLGCTPTYISVDVSPQLTDFLNAFFTRNKIPGRAFAADVTLLEVLPPADTVLLFKALDVLERLRYGYAEVLLERLCLHEKRRVIVSFATATIGGGREIKTSKRSWVERWCHTHKLHWRTHEIPGELFYVIGT